MIWLPKVAAVEIGSNTVRIALVRTGPRRPRVLALVKKEIIERDEDEGRKVATIRAVQSALADLKSAPDVWVSCISGRNALVRVISVPFTRMRQIRSTVKFELEAHVPLRIDDLVVDFSRISGGGGETRVLAVAVKKETVRDHLDILAEAGIDPEVVDADFASLTALWLRDNRVSDKDVTVLVHVTGNGALLVIMRGTKMLFLRGLDLSAERLRQDADGVAEQILMTLRAFAASSKDVEITGLVFTGARLSVEQCTELERKLGLSVSSCALGASVVLADVDAGENADSWSAVIGSASGYDGRRGARFNFRREELAATSAVADARNHLMFSGALVLLLLLAGVGYLRTRVHMMRAEKDAYESRMVEVYKETFGDSSGIKRSKVPAMMARALNERQKEYETYRSYLTERASVLDTMREIVTRVPDSDDLVIKELSINEGSFAISGRLAGAAAVKPIEKQLDGSPLLKDIVVTEQSSDGTTGQTTFRIVGKRV